MAFIFKSYAVPSLCHLLSLTHCQLGPDDLTREEEQGSATHLETQRLRSVTTPTGVCTHGCGCKHGQGTARFSENEASEQQHLQHS